MTGKAAKEFRRVNKEILIGRSFFDFFSPPQKKEEMQAAMISSLEESNPTLANFKIRVDERTQQASVLDLIKMVTGLPSRNAANYFNRLDPELSTKCRQLRINGKGRETPVADAPTCIEIIWVLPGKAAKEFRRASAHKICRLK